MFFSVRDSVNNRVNYTYSIRVEEKHQGIKRARIHNNGAKALPLILGIAHLCIEHIMFGRDAVN